jgi:hypothetical protein
MPVVSKKLITVVLAILLVTIVSVSSFVVISPSLATPATDYAKQKGISNTKISSLDSDHLLDQNETMFIDHIAQFTADQQEKFIDSFLADGVLSFEEIRQIHFLSGFSKAQEVQYIDNAMFADFDWSKDNICNDFQKDIMGVSPDVQTERFALLVETENENITGYMNWLIDYLVNNQKFKPEHIFLLKSDNATKVNFEKVTQELSQKVKENDTVFVQLSFHGNEEGVSFSDGHGNAQTWAEWVSYKDYIDPHLDIIKPKYMSVAVFACSCHYAPEILAEPNRAIATITIEWILASWSKYENYFGTPDPQVIDHDGNGYLSWDDIVKTASEYQNSTDRFTTSDKGNIASKIYLGDAPIS